MSASDLAHLEKRLRLFIEDIRDPRSPHESWCEAKGRCTYCDVAIDLEDILNEEFAYEITQDAGPSCAPGAGEPDPQGTGEPSNPKPEGDNSVS